MRGEEADIARVVVIDENPGPARRNIDPVRPKPPHRGGAGDRDPEGPFFARPRLSVGPDDPRPSASQAAGLVGDGLFDRIPRARDDDRPDAGQRMGHDGISWKR